MSDQLETSGGAGATLGLEDVFLSREFGRTTARWVSSAVATAEFEPEQALKLEQVFLSEVFGHSGAIAAAGPAPETSQRPGQRSVCAQGGRAVSTPRAVPTTPSGGTLAPALSVVGNAISGLGSSVTTTMGDPGEILPVSSISSSVGTMAATAVNNLGGGSRPGVLASALRK